MKNKILNSKITTIVLFVLYFLLFYEPNEDLLFNLGMATGSLLPAAIIVLLLSRKYQWTRLRKVTNVLIAGFIIKVLSYSHPLLFFVNLVSILSLLVLIIFMISDLFKKRK